MLILGMLVVLVVLNLVLTALMFNKMFCKTPAQRLDEEVERESMRRSREMDEGFDNLMRYSVNGNDGFGGV
jgi:hypothetical protein